ncbi:Uncharacterised protein [Bordetella pertussis]|nr:Uncharacterised protein [Bordetella pertussis]
MAGCRNEGAHGAPSFLARPRKARSDRYAGLLCP